MNSECAGGGQDSNAVLVGAAQIEPVEVYSTFDCRIGRHPFCVEGTAREPDPEVPQVTYLPCGCECHGPVGAR